MHATPLASSWSRRLAVGLLALMALVGAEAQTVNHLERRFYDHYSACANAWHAASATDRAPYQEMTAGCARTAFDRSAADGGVPQARLDTCAADPNVSRRRDSTRTAYGAIWNCAVRAEYGTAPPAPTPPSRSAPHAAADCSAFATAQGLGGAERQGFETRCRGSRTPMETLLQQERERSAGVAAARAREAQNYPLARVVADNRSWCEANNRSPTLVFDCQCMADTSARLYQEGQHGPRALAQKEWDTSPCIDRARSADVKLKNCLMATRNQDPAHMAALENRCACESNGIRLAMPRESLTSFDEIRRWTSQHCRG